MTVWDKIGRADHETREKYFVKVKAGSMAGLKERGAAFGYVQLFPAELRRSLLMPLRPPGANLLLHGEVRLLLQGYEQQQMVYLRKKAGQNGVHAYYFDKWARLTNMPQVLLQSCF